jgi:hypothetical protein
MGKFLHGQEVHLATAVSSSHTVKVRDICIFDVVLKRQQERRIYKVHGIYILQLV